MIKLSATTLAIVSLLVVAPGAARAQLYDHLKCYKIKDDAKFQAQVDLEALQAEFGVEDCKLVGKGKMFCVPVDKTVTDDLDKSKTGIPLLVTTSTSTSTTIPDLYCQMSLRLYDEIELGTLHVTLDDNGPAAGGLTNCRSAVVGATAVVPNSGHMIDFESLPAGFTGPALIMICDHFTHHSASRDPSFSDFDVTGVEATDRSGNPVPAPKVCVGRFQCDVPLPGRLGRCGDSDANNAITVTDALRSLQTATGSEVCRPIQSICDANGDGKITAPDAQLILRSAVGLDASLRCPAHC